MNHAPSPSTASPTPSATQVVIADDDRELRELIRELLEIDGYRVQVARDGHELTAIVRDLARREGAAPAVIISDVRMPGCTGLEALAVLAPLIARTAVVLMTGYSDDEALGAARRLGVGVVLSKPFDLDDLRALVVGAVPRA